MVEDAPTKLITNTIFMVVVREKVLVIAYLTLVEGEEGLVAVWEERIVLIVMQI